MREFSPFERELINRLLEGAELPGLITDWFRTNVKVMIRYAAVYNVFDYHASKENAARAHRELTEIILLLYYLDKHELLHKYTPPATTLRDLNAPGGQISLGEGTESNISSFVDHSSKYLTEYIKDNDNFVFRANEELRVLAQNDFVPREERNHRRSMRIAWATNVIAIVLGILSLLTAAYTTWQSHKDNQESGLKEEFFIRTLNEQKVRIDSLDLVVKKLTKQNKPDSIK